MRADREVLRQRGNSILWSCFGMGNLSGDLACARKSADEISEVPDIERDPIPRYLVSEVAIQALHSIRARLQVEPEAS